MPFIRPGIWWLNSSCKPLSCWSEAPSLATTSPRRCFAGGPPPPPPPYLACAVKTSFAPGCSDNGFGRGAQTMRPSARLNCPPSVPLALAAMIGRPADSANAMLSSLRSTAWPRLGFTTTCTLTCTTSPAGARRMRRFVRTGTGLTAPAPAPVLTRYLSTAWKPPSPGGCKNRKLCCCPGAAGSACANFGFGVGAAARFPPPSWSRSWKGCCATGAAPPSRTCTVTVPLTCSATKRLPL
mmetsp:Transcript_33062/g.104615  ORF Transcript_33062/g.104615 Transcript_33062/m.104615 type:complete len:239 (-) Transcript_33062:172-888(-)